jgi:hypothetical protein
MVCIKAPVFTLTTKYFRVWFDFARNCVLALSIGPVGPEPKTAYHSPLSEGSRLPEPVLNPWIRTMAGPVVAKPSAGFENSHRSDGYSGFVTSSAK